MKPAFVFFSLILTFAIATAQDSLSDRNSWKVSSKSVEKSGDKITYRGEVEAVKGDFSIKCDVLVLNLGTQQNISSFLATGKTVTIRRIGDKKQIQIAKSKRAEYTAEKGSIEISGGPPFLQNGDKYVNTGTMDSKIILEPKGKFRVIPKPYRGSPIIIPIGNVIKKLKDPRDKIELP